MKKTAVIGSPVSHSLSPVLHNFWCAQYGIDANYTAIDLPLSELAPFLKKLRSGEYVGANVTIPFKEMVFEMMDSLDATAQATGAVNTIVPVQGSKLHGLNTDPEGFINHLIGSVENFTPKTTNALVMGAGGAARAVTHALLEAGAPDIMVTSRTPEKDRHLAQVFNHANVKTISWQEKTAAINAANLIVNATPLGMKGYGELDVDFGTRREGAVVYDLVYNPSETLFLKKARAAGLEGVGGLGMLIHQAAPAFEAWFGIRPEINIAVHDTLVKHLIGRGD